MTRWTPQKKDVLEALAADILHNYGRGRVIVAIDGVDVTYESLCGSCYLDESGGVLNSGRRSRTEFSYGSAPDPDFM